MRINPNQQTSKVIGINENYHQIDFTASILFKLEESDGQIMNVLFQYQGLITESYKNVIRSQLPDDITLQFPEENEPDELASMMEEIDVFVGYNVSEQLLEESNQLKHIQIPWTGFDRMDIDILKNHRDRLNFTISNSHSNSLAIAEHAVSLLTSTAKRIPYRDGHMREGDWSTRYREDNGVWLTGKTLGVIGYGSIGKKAAKILHNGFNMEVMAIKRKAVEPDEICKFIGGPDDISMVLQESDFVIVAVPLTEETKGLLGTEELDKMKEKAILVNIARGPIIDEEALFNHLKEKKIFGAGIDTWYNYPSSDDQEVDQNYPFEELDNIVMTPHSAFKVREREEIFLQDIITNIKKIYDNEEPINQVNLEVGY